MTLHFDRKRILVLSIGLGVTGILIFSAGLVTGIILWTPTREEIAALKDAKPAEAVKKPAVPTLASLASAAKQDVKTAAPPPQPPAVPSPSEVPAAPVQPAAAPSADSPVPPAPAPSAAAPAAPPAPSASNGTPLNADAQDFSLQLGSFLDAKNAKQLQTDLKERGYAASIFTAMDSEQREWHVVRIGGYKTLASAAQAAANFSNKERIQALVRRSDAL